MLCVPQREGLEGLCDAVKANNHGECMGAEGNPRSFAYHNIVVRLNDLDAGASHLSVIVVSNIVSARELAEYDELNDDAAGGHNHWLWARGAAYRVSWMNE